MIIFTVILSLAIVAADEEKKKEEKTLEEPAIVDDSKPLVDPLAYTYNPFGKRNPFRSFLLDRTPETVQSTNPLLAYELSKFKLTGILWGVANPRAIVKDGANRGHIILRGTKIGINRGNVVRIMKDEVIVAEEFRDPLGKLIVIEHSMKLVNDQGKKK